MSSLDRLGGGSSGGGLTDTELRASPVPVSLTATTISNTVSVSQFGTWTVGISGSVPVTGTFWQATQPVSIAASVAVTQSGAWTTGRTWTLSGASDSVAITGSVAVTGTFWQTTQPVSLASVPSHPVTNAGTFAVQAAQSGSWILSANSGVDIGDVTINNASGAAAVNIQDGGNSITIDGSVTANSTTSHGKTITYVSVNQGAAGTTVLAAASVGNKHKVIGCCLVMDAAGTLKFNDGTVDLTGAMSLATNGGFVLATSILPYTETAATNRALNLITTTGKAAGVVAILTEA